MDIRFWNLGTTVEKVEIASMVCLSDMLGKEKSKASLVVRFWFSPLSFSGGQLVI